MFFSDADRRVYLEWLHTYVEEYALELIAYCLMTNHVHLVIVPPAAEALHRALRPLHTRFAQRLNRTRGWNGHVWQGRYHSSPLDERYLRAAVRYVERNPVRAKMAADAESYPWSSAAAHCGLRHDPLLSTNPAWGRRFADIGDWSAWLAEEEEQQSIATLRLHSVKGLPCGSDAFVETLEAAAGRELRCRPQGRPARSPEKGVRPL